MKLLITAAIVLTFCLFTGFFIKINLKSNGCLEDKCKPQITEERKTYRGIDGYLHSYTIRNEIKSNLCPSICSTWTNRLYVVQIVVFIDIFVFLKLYGDMFNLS